MPDPSDSTPTPTEDDTSATPTRPELPAAVREALMAEADRFQEAQKQMTDALGVLWNTQLEMAISTGNLRAFQRAMKGPLGLWDDCSCGCGPSPGPAAW